MSAIRYHCAADSLKAMELIQAAAGEENFGGKVMAAAKSMVGIPEAPPADNDKTGTIVIRLDSLDRRSFLNMALAAAQASMKRMPTLRDFENALEGVSRRKGKDEGFASQFLYMSDWIVDNVYRGNVKEMTEYIESGNYKTKTLDYITRNAEKFPAMADSLTREKVRTMELGYRSHRIPHLKKQSASNKAIQENMDSGDIILMLPPENDYDLYDLGIVEMKEGVPYLIHISPVTGVVSADDYPLARLFKLEGQHFYGYRWLRPTD